MPNPGRDFEAAVFEFARTLDPQAEVLFNHSVLDRDSDTPRQCDVWINARFGGHWPISILVSCKDHRRKLHIGDIGSFIDEIRSTGASMGVIYSKSGFTKPAVRKAKNHGISCCRLYRNEPADIPDLIWFYNFACRSRIKLELKSELPVGEYSVWNDVFDATVDDENTAIDLLAAVFREGEEQSIASSKTSMGFPADWAAEVEFTKLNRQEASLKIALFILWVKYYATLEATLINGSYCVTDNSFTGTLSGPFIDTQGGDPGPHWIEIRQGDFQLPRERLIAILYAPDFVKSLREGLGPKRLPTLPV